jgi:thymidine phosphorylase
MARRYSGYSAVRNAGGDDRSAGRSRRAVADELSASMSELQSSAPEAGYVSVDRCRGDWLGGRCAGHAGRERKEDTIDPAAYIYLDRKVWRAGRAGEPLCHFAAAPDWPEGDASVPKR